MFTFLITSLLPFARAHQGARCVTALGVPAAAAAQFADYVNPAFETPLRHVAFEGGGLYVHLTLRGADDDESDDPGNHEVWTRVELDRAQAPRRLKFLDLRISDRLDADFALRATLAHLLDRYPTITQIDFDFYGLPDFGRVRGALSRGESLAAAVTDTDAHRALAAFGFRLDVPNAKFLNQTPPLGLVLRMRLTREPAEI